MRILMLVLVLIVLLPAIPLPARAEGESYSVYGAERFFRLEWETSQRRGRPVVRGRIANEFGVAARDVRLRVEGLDADGRVISSTVGYVPGILTPGMRAWFEVPVSGPAASWRVSVLSFEWLQSQIGLHLPR